MAQLFECRPVTIRKPRECFGCLTVYPRGTIMDRRTVSDSEGVYHPYICKKCEIAEQYMVNTLGQDEFTSGELKNYYSAIPNIDEIVD